MWRPLETFLDDGWPPIGERRFHDRASRMAVPVPYSDHAPTTVAS